MDGLTLSLLGFAIMLGLIFLRMPIGVALLLTGFFGTWAVTGRPNMMMAQLKSLSWETFSSYSLSVVPLFLLMGQFATRSGMSRRLFRAAADCMGHWKGGVAMASVGACAGFGAVCGSSLATASTMGQVALPEMRRLGYSGRLSTGVLAAGGTLGILIPPSVILVIYAILTEQNIAKMFLAAIVPGLLAALGYIIVVAIYARLRPAEASSLPRKPWAERAQALIGIWPVLLIFGLVMWGIAGDANWAQEGQQALFTPTEGAAVGAVLTGLYGIWSGGLTLHTFFDCVKETAVTTAMIFLIVLGAQVFNSFLALTQTPQALADWVTAQGFAPLTVLIFMLALYLVFGCVMDSLSMILLTIPIFYPIVVGLDFGLTPEETAIWFGVLSLIVVEVGLITPPVGMNLFIIASMARDVPVTETYRGVLPFVLSDLARTAILVAFPAISLFLIRGLH